MNPIAILTDFGTADSYVGEMKGVITGIAPRSKLVDITHALPAGDVQVAAFTLWRVFRAWPVGTIFLVVVDPGVGTARRPVAVRFMDRIVICPDNGILSYILPAHDPVDAVTLENPVFHSPHPSRTFHGRDIFSPVAAHLAVGIDLAELGPLAKDLVRLPPPLLKLQPPRITGEVLQIDHFGNLTTSIGIVLREKEGLSIQPWFKSASPKMLVGSAFRVILPGHTALTLHSTYDDVHEDALAYIGSAGLLEIGIRNGNASQVLELKPGAQIFLERKE